MPAAPDGPSRVLPHQRLHGAAIPTVVANLLAQLLEGLPGDISAGEVGLPIERDGKVLPCGIYGRWQASP